MWPFATTRSRSPSLSKSASAVPHFSGRKVSRPDAGRAGSRPRRSRGRAPCTGSRSPREKLRDEEVRDPVAVHVAHGDAHAGLGGAVGVEGRERRHPDLLEARPCRRCGRGSSDRSRWRRRGRDRPSPSRSAARTPKPKPRARSFMPASSVASTKRPSRLRKKWSGAPLRPNGPKATCLAAPRHHSVRCALEDVLERAVDVVRDVEVEPAVAVRIEEGRSRVPARRLDPGRPATFSNVPSRRLR